jgi:hypothetical protein
MQLLPRHCDSNVQQPTSSGEASVTRPLLAPDTVQVFTFTLPPEGCSSVTSDYILDRAIGVRSPAQVTDFSQTGSEAHSASCTMGTRGPFPGVNRGRGVTLTTHPHLVSGSRMWSYIHPHPLVVYMAVARQLLPEVCVNFHAAIIFLLSISLLRVVFLLHLFYREPG